jgi:Mrp family chromosome partitioning ATPase/uncharacterized protein involved in exopolysaccharide biosynthesis
MTAPQPLDTPFDPTLLGSSWRYRWLVLTVIVTLGLVGFAASGLEPRQEQWQATATLVIGDPTASTLFERTGQQPYRYVENQAAVVRSIPVAEAAQALLEAESPPIPLEVTEIVASLDVVTNTNTDAIALTFSSHEERAAIAGANAVIVAYEDVRRTEVYRGFQASLDQIDASIAESNNELATLQERIDALVATTVARDELDAQLLDALDGLTSLDWAAAAASPEELAALETEIADVIDQLEELQRGLASEQQPAELSALLLEQSKAIERKSSLIARRDQLRVDLELLGSGVLVASPAIEATAPEAPSYVRNVILAILLGIPLGTGVAYVLALRRRTFGNRNEPEQILGIPLLAEIPDFRDERLTTEVPVRDAPDSIAAEGFRFAAASLDLRVAPLAVETASRAANGFSVAFVAPGPGQGKTVVTANTALAAATEGRRVLAIDGDLGDPRLSRELLAHQDPSYVNIEISHSAQAQKWRVVDVPLPGGTGTLHLLGHNGLGARAATFYSSDEARALIKAAEAAYDMVLIDVPPLLHVAYASTLISHVMGVAMVVQHGTRVSAVNEAKNRVDLAGPRLIGYVFNRAPLRRDLRGSVASLFRSRALEENSPTGGPGDAPAAITASQRPSPSRPDHAPPSPTAQPKQAGGEPRSQ